MELKYEIVNLREFEAWSGAVETKEKIIDNDLSEEFMELIEELYPYGLTEVELNDILWFEAEWLFSKLGLMSGDDDE